MLRSFFIFYSIVGDSANQKVRKDNGLLQHFTKSFFVLCFILWIGNNNCTAQTKGYVYADSSLLENPDDTQANTVQPADETDTILYTHTINISADTINAWKNDKRFGYVKNLDSLLKLREKEELDEYRSVSNSSPSFLQNILSSGFLRAFFWLIAGAIVLFILYNLFLNKGIFKRSTSSLPVKELPEEQHDINDASDYDALIQQSYKLSDYRMAVRYLFLKTLRQLTDKGLLQGSVDKTNFQYVQEIAPDKKKDFASLVLNYEYVWYGNLKITREQYSQMEKGYASFYNKIG